MQAAFLLLPALVLVAQAGQPIVPRQLLGDWIVGPPYDTKQPIGLNNEQEERLKNLTIRVAKNHIQVCGNVVPVKSLRVENLSSEQFLSRFNLSPNKIGLRAPFIREVTINEFQATNACGNFEDPGTHLLVTNQRVVMEVGNEYFPLEKHFEER